MNANEPPLQPNRTIMVGDRSARLKLACAFFRFRAFFCTACCSHSQSGWLAAPLFTFSLPSASTLNFPAKSSPRLSGHRHTVWAGWGSTHPSSAPHYLLLNALNLCFRGYYTITSRFPANFQVLTGVATLDNARAAAAGAQPHHVTQSLGDVAALYAHD
jgi:hypothetical protein